ncbi:MAG: hypothetical protein DELT_01547 [Desulfovibrio sp.]
MELAFSLLWWHWCVAGLALVALEIFVPGVFLLWFGLGALATGVITALTGIASWEMQCLVFVPFTFLSLFIGRKILRKTMPQTDSALNRRLASCVGRAAEVTQAIQNGVGRIKLGDTVWIARGEDCPVGTQVTVTGYSGSDLLVEKTGKPS